MASKKKSLAERDLVLWDELFDKFRPRGPGVMLVACEHVVIGLPPSTDRRLKSNVVRLTDWEGDWPSLRELYPVFDIRRIYAWVIDLNERGYFSAHVEDAGGAVVIACNNEEHDDEGNVELGELWLTVDGFMRHIDDTAGMTDYLRSMGVIGAIDSVWPEQRFFERIRLLEERHGKWISCRSPTAETAHPA